MVSLDERILPNEQTWLEDVCARFTSATGWPLKYTPSGEDGGGRIETHLAAATDCTWMKAIHDGRSRKGFLHLELPAGSSDDRRFLAVVELAETFAELLTRLAHVTRKAESHTEDISTLVDIGRAVSREDDLKLALDQLLKATLQLTGFRASGFFLLDPSANCLNLRLEHSQDGCHIPHHSRDLRNAAPDLEAMARGPMTLRRTASPAAQLWLPDGYATGVCVAVQSESGPVGTLWAFDRRARIPSDRELHVLESLAAQVATVLERVVLLRESESQHRLQRELRLVGESQSGEKLCPVPDESPIEVAGRCRSRWELGGDLCELVALDAHRTIVAVGDASGDSIPAAIVMTAVRGGLQTILTGGPEQSLATGEVVRRINQALGHMTAAHQFMSFFYGVLDTAEMTFTYTNAGHPNPLLIRESECTQLSSHGLLLGVSDGATYGSSVQRLAPGDLLVLFSDGIVEAMNRERRMFRSDGILEVLQTTAGRPAAESLDAVWNRAEDHAADGGSPDDRTLLIIRVRENSAGSARG